MEVLYFVGIIAVPAIIAGLVAVWMGEW